MVTRRVLTFVIVCLGLTMVLHGQAPGSVQANLTSATCPGSGCLQLDLQGQAGVAFQLQGTFSGTASFEGTVDGGTWVALSVTPTNSTTTVTTATAAGVWYAGVGGLISVRVRVSTYSSGTVIANIRSALVSASRGGGGGGSTIVCGDTQVFFADGANTQGCDAGMTFVKASGLFTAKGLTASVNDVTIPAGKTLRTADADPTKLTLNNGGNYILGAAPGGVGLFIARDPDFNTEKFMSISGRSFSQLGTPTNGFFTYCTDCTITAVCAGVGTGAFAKRLNGVWVCN